ncbi:bile salt-activated lipase [Trichonephila clavipes]|nr:bile salt-activated lipase [Trichonephila clavipes]
MVYRNLRHLQEPLMFPGWAGTLDARDYRSVCPQWDLQGRMKGAEDCLFINVFTPSLPASGSFSPVTYPVMIFIHGGNFEEGSANIYGPEKLMDKGIILVTFNYRIGVFGFLSSGDSTCPGNMGLKDQVLAIRWVRENIDRFGGDPNAITIFGQGSGAASVLMHILSPQSQGLFSRAIMQSGSALCDWALEGEPLGFAREIAQRAKCPTDSSSAILDCMRLKPVMDILNAQKETKSVTLKLPEVGKNPVDTAYDVGSVRRCWCRSGHSSDCMILTRSFVFLGRPDPYSTFCDPLLPTPSNYHIALTEVAADTVYSTNLLSKVPIIRLPIKVRQLLVLPPVTSSKS